MASTPLNFQITPIRGGAVTFDGAVTPVAVVPTTVFLRKTDAAQVDPNASGYALSSVAGWLYSCTVSDAIVGIYYWYAVDADENIIADGYVYIAADDTATYRAAPDYASCFAGRSNTTRTKVSATETTLVETIS